jgi:hypothetical protein
MEFHPLPPIIAFLTITCGRPVAHRHKLPVHRKIISCLDAMNLVIKRSYMEKTKQLTKEEIDENEWLCIANANHVFDFLKEPEEDIYTSKDGRPFHYDG